MGGQHSASLSMQARDKQAMHPATKPAFPRDLREFLEKGSAEPLDATPPLPTSSAKDGLQPEEEKKQFHDMTVDVAPESGKRRRIGPRADQPTWEP